MSQGAAVLGKAGGSVGEASRVRMLVGGAIVGTCRAAAVPHAKRTGHSLLTVMRPRGILSVSIVALVLGAGPSAAAQVRWSKPRTIDTAAYIAAPSKISSVSCPSTTLCVAGGEGGTIETSTDPSDPSSWQSATIDPSQWIESVSCPSTSLCVAADSGGTLLTSTSPTGGAPAWTPVSVGLTNGAGASVSCPSASLCVAEDGMRTIATSTNPAGGAGAWTESTLPSSFQLGPIACPTTSLCVIAGFSSIVTSTDPTGGPAAWSAANLDLQDAVPTAVSCASETECVVTDSDGHVLTASHPAGGSSAWTLTDIDGVDAIAGVACVAGGPCVAGDLNGSFLTSTAPLGGASSWSRDRGVDPSGIQSVTCPSAALCVAGDSRGEIVSSTDPVNASARWAIGPQFGMPLATAPSLNAITCAGTAICAAVDNAGNVLTTTTPTDAGGGWEVTNVNPVLTLNDISCPRAAFCAAVGPGGYVATSRSPTAGAGSWTLTDLDLTSNDVDAGGYPADNLDSVSCASPSLCVATRYGFGPNDSEVATNPAGGPSGWQARKVGPGYNDILRGVSCPSLALCATGENGRLNTSTDGGTHWRSQHVEHRGKHAYDAPSVMDLFCSTNAFCILVDDHGTILTSTHPTGAAGDWHRVHIAGAEELTHVACASDKLCVALGDHARVYASTDPLGGTGAWKESTIHGLTDVACPSPRVCLATTTNGKLVTGTVRR